MTKRIFILLLAVLVAMAALPLPAQENTGTVKGKVTDENSKPIVNATVRFTSKDGKKVETKTEKTGEFVKTGIPVGSYKVELLVDGNPRWASADYVPVNAGAQNPLFNIDLAAAIAASKMTDEQRKQIEEQQKKSDAERVKVKNLNAKLVEAKGLMDSGNVEGALAIYQDAVQIDPSRDLLWANLGGAYVAKAAKTADKAQSTELAAKGAEAMQKAISIKPGDAKYHNNLGQAYTMQGNTADALKEYTQAAQLDPPGAAMFYFNAGAILTNEATKSAPGSPEQKQKIEQADEMFRKSAAADPKYNNGEAYYQLATNLLNQATLSKDGKMIVPDGTIEAYQKYLAESPNGRYAESAKQTLAALGSTVETTYKKTGSGGKKK